MISKTLLISKEIPNHSFFKNQLEELGFPNVTLTALRSDALRSFIDELDPDLIMMGARYYHCSTPYMMGELHKQFPKKNMAAVSIGEYPAELGMSFIVNRIKSWVTTFDGFEQFYKGLEEVRKGRKYISPAAQERLDMRSMELEPADTITGRRTEVIRLACNGFTKFEIADTLEISRSTVANHKTEIFRSLNVRNVCELRRAAINTGLLTEDELNFCPNNIIVSPLPDQAKSKKNARRKYL